MEKGSYNLSNKNRSTIRQIVLCMPKSLPYKSRLSWWSSGICFIRCHKILGENPTKKSIPIILDQLGIYTDGIMPTEVARKLIILVLVLNLVSMGNTKVMKRKDSSKRNIHIIFPNQIYGKGFHFQSRTS